MRWVVVCFILLFVSFPSLVSAEKNTSLIKILDTKIVKKDYKPVYLKGSDLDDAQPILFDPAASKAAATFLSKESFKLAKPYKMIIYEFGEASTISYVVEVKKGNSRQSLYTHVINYNVSKDGKYLFLANYVADEKKKWERKIRIIDIAQNKSVSLPARYDCVSSEGLWDGGKLITYQDVNELGKSGIAFDTKVCLWDAAGKLQNRLEAEFHYMGASSYILHEKIGLLPRNQNVFYFIGFGRAEDENGCYIYMKKLDNSEIVRSQKLSDNSVPNCAEFIKVDLSKIKY